MEKKITGIMIYYYKVCKRKLWYYCNEIKMEQNNENVQIGKLLDEYSYQRDDKHISIDDVINIDFIRKDKVIHEVKKSRQIEEASIYQVKYYLYYLYKRGVSDISGKIDYPLLKQNIEVHLCDDDVKEIENIINNINIIIKEQNPPRRIDCRICKQCAYYDLCYI